MRLPDSAIAAAVAARPIEPEDSASLAAFWWQHARIPIAMLICLALITERTTLDRSIAHYFFYDLPTHRWIGAGNWWINAVLHQGGRWLVRGIVVSSLLVWVTTWIRSDWRAWRQPSLYFTVTMVLALGIVGLLKTWTNVDCPWDLQEFGGRFAYFQLFVHRPAVLRHAQCFPAAHASSGYALMALYFVIRERSLYWARIGIATGVALGLVFGIAQQARGAHFLSHDAWSACITWIVALTVYVAVFRNRLWSGLP